MRAGRNAKLVELVELLGALAVFMLTYTHTIRYTILLAIQKVNFFNNQIKINVTSKYIGTNIQTDQIMYPPKLGIFTPF